MERRVSGFLAVRAQTAMHSFMWALSLAVLAPLASPLAAQPSRAPVAPQQPGTPPQRTEQDAAFVAWRLNQQSTDTNTWIVRGSPRYLAVIRLPLTNRGTVHTDLLRAGLEACRARLGLETTVVDSLVAHRPFAALDSVMREYQMVEITVIPRGARPLDCDVPREGIAATTAVTAEGIFASSETLSSAANSADAVAVLAGDDTHAPSYVVRAPTVRLAADGYVGRESVNSVRLYVPLDAFVAADGGNTSVRLRISSSARSEPEFLEIPAADVTRLIRAMLPWRLARLAKTPEPALPVERALTPRLKRAEMVQANLETGLAFTSAGDDAMGRWFVHRALLAEPCLTLSSTAPNGARVVVSRMRPKENCESVGTGAVLRGSWYPGRAQRLVRPDVRSAGIVTAAIVAMTAGASIAMHLQADKLYADYESEQTNPQAKFFLARDAHVRANLVGTTMYALWVGSIAQAIWEDRRRAARIANVRDYDLTTPRAMRLTPAPQGLGLSIHFF